MAIDDKALIEQAKAVRKQAYAPYSGFCVGAAILDDKGGVHIGCNVENVSYPEGLCAEANAIGSMVAAGGTRIVTIAVVGGAEKLQICTPCGGCRQNIQEFATEETRIILLGDHGKVLCYTMDELLPAAFTPSNLRRTPEAPEESSE